MINVCGVGKNFDGLQAVDNVTLHVGAGRILALMGPNGAGKTTLVRMIAGLITPDVGRIDICGYDAASQRVQAQSCIGYLSEGANVYGEMTVRRFLSFVGASHGWSKPAVEQAIERSAEELSLQPVMSRLTGTLSKGYRRRAALAAAVLHNPPILILDEPGDGLDPDVRHDVRSYIRRIAAGKAIIISTHMPDEAASLCTDAAVMINGRIGIQGTIDELTQDPCFDVSELSRSERLEKVFRRLTGSEHKVVSALS